MIIGCYFDSSEFVLATLDSTVVESKANSRADVREHKLASARSIVLVTYASIAERLSLH